MERQALHRQHAKAWARSAGASRLTAGLLSCYALAGVSPPAAAQDTPAGDAAISVQKRPRPDFDAIPIRFGGFEVLPSVEARMSYDDNIYAARTHKVDDALATVLADVSAHSTWERHSISLDAKAALTRGLSQSDEDTQTYDTQLSGRLDLGVGTSASLRAGYGRAYEPRGSIGDTSLRGRRIAYDTLDLNAQVQRTAGRLVLEAEATLESFRYAPYRTPGVPVAGANRDYRSWSAGLRAGYAVSPGIAAFVEGTWNEARYPDENSALNRSSSGYSVRGGLQLGLTRLIRGRAAVGYQDQAYDDAAFPRIRGLDFGVDLEWNPTALVTWTVQARRSVQRSPIIGVAGIRQSRYGTQIDYELRRNVLVSTRLDRTVSDFAGTQRVQKDLAATLSLDWLVNRSLRVSAGGGFQRTRSEGPAGRRFDRRRVSIALRYTL